VLEVPWPDSQDVILMSYLVSAVAEESVSHLLDRAVRALEVAEPPTLDESDPGMMFSVREDAGRRH
jgi:hypothetical protein